MKLPELSLRQRLFSNCFLGLLWDMKKPLLQFAVLFLLLLPLLGRAQEIRISGQIIDLVTKKPIPFVLIRVEGDSVARSNRKGHYHLWGLKNKNQDSLLFTAPQYYSRTIIIERGYNTNKQVIGLRHFLSSVEIADRAKWQQEIESAVLPLPGVCYAFFIGNENHAQTGNMKTVSFFVGENGLPKEYFRVRIYKADGVGGAPKTDLLDENVIYSPHAANGWSTFDLSSYGITTLGEGFYIGVEFVVLDYRMPQTMERYTPTGKIMQPSLSLMQQRIWTHFDTYFDDWKELARPNVEKISKYNKMIRVEVE